MYKILLVHDDPHILASNETYLKKHGYDTATAADGLAALQLCSTAAFDAVIMDVDMPGMDGVSVCRRLREVSSVPIIFLSAYARTDDRIRGLMAGGRRLRRQALFPHGARAEAAPAHTAPQEH